jgi:hypothetical protein
MRNSDVGMTGCGARRYEHSYRYLFITLAVAANFRVADDTA